MKKFLFLALPALCLPLAVIAAGLTLSRKWRDYYAV